MKPKKASAMTRRGWLKSVVALGSGAALSGCSTQRHQSGNASEREIVSKKNLIRQENELPGTLDWLLTHPRISAETKYRCPWIEGYCSRASVRAGESLSVFVGTNPLSDFSLGIYRMG